MSSFIKNTLELKVEESSIVEALKLNRISSLFDSDGYKKEFGFFRYIQSPNIDIFKKNTEIKNLKASSISILINCQDDLKLIESFNAIQSFTNKLLKMYQYHISSKEANKYSLDHYEKEANKTSLDLHENESKGNFDFEEFKEACFNFNKFSKEYELPKEIFSKFSSLDYFLIDDSPDSNGNYLAKALKVLAIANNRIEANVNQYLRFSVFYYETSNLKSSLNYMDEIAEKKRYSIQKIILPTKKSDIDIDDIISRSYICSPLNFDECKYIFDFARIEMYMGHYLQYNKKMDEETLDSIKYSDRLDNIYNKNSGIINQFRNKLRDLKFIRLTVEEIRSLRSFIKARNEKEGINYYKPLLIIIVLLLDQWNKKQISIADYSNGQKNHALKVLATHNELTEKSIMNTLEIFELAEEYEFENKENSISRPAISKETEKIFNDLIKVINSDNSEILPEKDDIKSAWIRMMSRNKEISGKKYIYIRNLIIEFSLWNYGVDHEKIIKFSKLVSETLELSDAIIFYDKITDKKKDINVKGVPGKKAGAGQVRRPKLDY